MKSTRLYESFHFLLLLCGDMAVFIGSLALALYLRNGFLLSDESWNAHREPFIILFVLWIFLLLAADLYNPRRSILRPQTLQNTLMTFVIWLLLALGFFYFASYQEINPKTVLFIDALILTCGFLFWRYFAGKLLRRPPMQFALFGYHSNFDDILSEIKKHGRAREFQCSMVATDRPDQLPASLKNNEHIIILPFEKISRDLFAKHGVEMVVPAEEHLREKWGDFFFRELLPGNIKVEKFSRLYEDVAQKIPLEIIDANWFLENFDESRFNFYEKTKRVFDVLGVLLLAIPLSIVSLIIMLFLALERKTKIFYSQKRVKKGGGEFIIYKFASMVPDAEYGGPRWAAKNDSRVTAVGRLIRKFHLDEIPQIINILKGEMSFVGPRPERPEFVEQLQKKNPFYFQRFLVRPGLTGWAQLNYPYGETVEDAVRKLQYELYYIKHRSIIFDLEIFLRSVRVVFFPPRR